jgi:5'-3' exonuclease
MKASQENKQEPVWLIDASIYVFRAWFTWPDDLKDANGNPINAVLGFMDFVYNLLQQENPQIIGFAFDESLQTSHRNDIYPDYKANRQSAPANLKYQFQLCRQFIRALGITELASPHYEADDILATWARQYHQQGHPVNIITADKDLTQLIHKNDHWWDYQKNKKLNTKQIQKEFGVRPDQIADLLALAGDKADNIPGIPGVGITTAAKLLRRFDTIDNLLAHIPDISKMKIHKAKLIQDAVEETKDKVIIYQQLTRVVDGVEAAQGVLLKRSSINQSELERLLNSLLFL